MTTLFQIVYLLAGFVLVAVGGIAILAVLGFVFMYLLDAKGATPATFFVVFAILGLLGAVIDSPSK